MISINKIILPLILLITALLRFIWLDRIPHSINGDGLYYLLTAKALALTSHDLSQTLTLFDLLLFRYPPVQLPQAELLHIILIPFIGFQPFSLLNSFLPNAVFGILTVLLIFLISQKLLNKQAAIFAALVSSLNPWFIFISRSAYEMMPAVFFYLCSLLLLLKTKGWKILFALPLFILAFYSYIATKLIILPVALIFILYCWYFINRKKYKLQYLLLFIFLTLFVGFYIYRIQTDPAASRISEIAKVSTLDVGVYVDGIRHNSIATPFTSIFVNKFTAYFSLLSNNLASIFSPGYLFLNGDHFASLYKYGLFYQLDLIFLFFGLVWLFVHKKSVLLFLGSLIFISILPEIFVNFGESKNFTPHITLLFPFVFIIIGIGFWHSFHELLRRKLKIPVVLISILYLYSVGSFLNIYFFQLPLLDNFYNYPNRILSGYINRSEEKNKPIRIFTNDPKGKFKEYIFYNNLYSADNALSISAALQKNTHTLANVSFLSCGDMKKLSRENGLFIIQAQCDISSGGNAHLYIPRLSDSGSEFIIYHDKICAKYPLNKYISNISINDFTPENMSNKLFCQKFITAP